MLKVLLKGNWPAFFKSFNARGLFVYRHIPRAILALRSSCAGLHGAVVVPRGRPARVRMRK